MPAPPAAPPSPPEPRVVDVVVALLGRACFASASSTVSPAVRPFVTWLWSLPINPTVTGTTVDLPSFRTVTVCRVPTVVIAEFGTSTALAVLPVVMETSAPTPTCKEAVRAARVTVTGKVVSEPDVVLNRPMSVTVPLRASVRPSTAIVAAWPVLISATSESGTSTVTAWLPALSRVMVCPLDIDPAVRLTLATVPATGLFSEAAASLCFASSSCASAESIAA